MGIESDPPTNHQLLCHYPGFFAGVCLSACLKDFSQICEQIDPLRSETAKMAAFMVKTMFSFTNRDPDDVLLCANYLPLQPIHLRYQMEQAKHKKYVSKLLDGMTMKQSADSIKCRT